jgi:hypothetical protein
MHFCLPYMLQCQPILRSNARRGPDSNLAPPSCSDARCRFVNLLGEAAISCPNLERESGGVTSWAGLESDGSLVTPESLPGHKEGALSNLAPATVKADRLICQPQADLNNINIQFLPHRERLCYLHQLGTCLGPAQPYSGPGIAAFSEAARARPWRVPARGTMGSYLASTTDVLRTLNLCAAHHYTRRRRERTVQKSMMRGQEEEK